jgi:type I restriction enzyme S subunit
VTSAVKQFNHVDPVVLGRVVRLVNERVTPSEDFLGKDVNYIGLANIAPHTGELAGFSPVKGESILSSSVSYKLGDILFGRMRPYLNKVWVAEFDGICSGEALVLRPDRSRVNTAFLHALLLSRITLNHVIPRQSGTSLPRVVAYDVLGTTLPIPSDMEQQVRIGAEALRRRTEAKQLRAEAEALIAEAKARVDRMILGEERLP